MSEQQPDAADTLYLDLEHFALTTEAGPPLEPKARVLPVGRPFPGLPVRPDEERDQ
ncbi:hypothetical protein [Streptomyces caniscabiei]|uniref:Uncharacterized protein n=1 Tax=Streptomyces caniscabiei TaxID=2746961 RepID=A0ABU4MSM1_9ACTN|nr:hypothetical protein [Streptomyces caniscabiei]MDX2954589.1 hypothetical protein [Streptomyces caniscabiei]MDX3039439.1 hypothetical protein [Streptomyces caniscabiei]